MIPGRTQDRPTTKNLRSLTICPVVFLLALVLVGCNDPDDFELWNEPNKFEPKVKVEEKDMQEALDYKPHRLIWKDSEVVLRDTPHGVEITLPLKFSDRTDHAFEIYCDGVRTVFKDMDTNEELTHFYDYNCDERKWVETK